MTSLLMCCRTQQSVIEQSTTIATDTTTITRVVAKDSTTTQAKIDSIIIEVYNQGDEEKTECVNKKRNYISQNKVKPPTKKIKIYGVSLSSTKLANKDSLNKQTAHQEKTISQVKRKTPTKSAEGGKIVYVLIGITLLLFAGYVVWKNAVQ